MNDDILTAAGRVTQNFRLIWLDPNIDELSDDFRKCINQIKRRVNLIDTFTDVDRCIDFFTEITDDKIFMVISNILGYLIVPFIHDFSQLNTIFIVSDDNGNDEQWIRNWPKITDIYMDINCICDALEQVVRQCDHNTIPISFVSFEDVSNTKLDELDQSFMYTQVLKEILFEIKHNEQSIKDFVTYCKSLFADNNTTLDKISKFETEYRLKTPVWWYTAENFIYSVLNRALRTLEVTTIIKMGFFMYDLHQEIQKLHLGQFGDKHISFTVYRGQSLLKEDFEKLMKSKDGLMSFNNFLSTTEDRDVAFAFAESNAIDCNSVGILFEITIDTFTPTTPFARINEMTNYDFEKELLFSMHAVFRIENMKEVTSTKNLWVVELKVTNDDDPLLHALTIRFRQETQDTTGWHRLARLLITLGQFNKAEEIYTTILDQDPIDEDEKASLFDQLGYIKQEQGDNITATIFYDKVVEILTRILPRYHPRIIHAYNNCALMLMRLGEYPKALSALQISLSFRQQILSPDHPDLAASYNNIGDLYNDMNDYTKALSAYEKALDIFKKTLPRNHPDLVNSYTRIGNVYNKIGQYPQALLLYEKALEIKQKVLPPEHQDIANAYVNIANLYNNTGDYSKTLLYLEKALVILEKTVAFNHPNLATCFSNIGSTYGNMNEISKALLFHKKALKIEEANLPSDHPDLAHSYTCIGSVYDHMNDYTEALSFYDKALTIYQKALPLDHLDIGSLYNNIGNVYKNRGEYSISLSYCEKALEICQKNLPSNHFVLLTSYHNIGKVCQTMREYSKALIFYQKALEIQEKTLASNHPDLAHLYGNIAELYMKTGEYSKALPFYEKALKIQQQILPPDHIDLAMTYNGIGTAYKNLGDPLKAFPYIRRFLEIAKPQINLFHPDA